MDGAIRGGMSASSSPARDPAALPGWIPPTGTIPARADLANAARWRERSGTQRSVCPVGMASDDAPARRLLFDRTRGAQLDGGARKGSSGGLRGPRADSPCSSTWRILCDDDRHRRLLAGSADGNTGESDSGRIPAALCTGQLAVAWSLAGDPAANRTFARMTLSGIRRKRAPWSYSAMLATHGMRPVEAGSPILARTRTSLRIVTDLADARARRCEDEAWCRCQRERGAERAHGSPTIPLLSCIARRLNPASACGW